jgi:hypothetical protein
MIRYIHQVATHKILIGEVGGKRPFCRPKQRLWHRIDHREMGCEGMNWIEGLNIELSG